MNYQSQVNSRPRLDIYRLSAGFVMRKLMWDMTLPSIRSRRRLIGMRDGHSGKKAVILCNGPSLNKVDFDMLRNSGIYTIGLNKINLLFNRTDFRPNLIVAVNKLVIEQNADFYNETDIDLILDSYAAKLVDQRSNVNYVYSLPFQLRFAKDVTGSICQGYTVTYAALQIAFHLGFEKVALVGCDHSFATKGSANMTVTSGEKDPNHFDPNYFAGGAKWQLPDLLGSEIHYKLARETYETSGREILNCTEGGELDLFNRMHLTDFIDG